jgi:hypothetical protein
MPIVRVKMGTAMPPSRRLPVFLVGAFPIESREGNFDGCIARELQSQDWLFR